MFRPSSAEDRVQHGFSAGAGRVVADRSVRATQTVAAHGSLLLSGWEAAGDDRGKFLDGDVEGFHGVWQ